MVHRCTVLGCKSEWYPGCGVKFHLFPKDPRRRTKWLSIVPIKTKFYESSKICSLHFQKTDYIGNFLHQAASPFFNKNTETPEMLQEISSKPLLKTNDDHRYTGIKRTYKQAILSCHNRNILPVTNLPGPSTSTSIPLSSDNQITDQQPLDAISRIRKVSCDSDMMQDECSIEYPQVKDKNNPVIGNPLLCEKSTEVKLITNREKKLLKKNKILVQKVVRKNKFINKMKSLLAIVKKYTAQSEIENIIKGNFSNIHRLFNKKKAHPQGVRYCNEVIAFALTLYLYSPKAYNYLNKFLALPHPETFKRSLSSFHCNV